jgi:hypothetical protein
MRASALLLIVSAGLAGLGLWAVPAGGADGVEDDPIPLRRVLLSPDRLPAELERARQGTLVKLPLTEFETRVREARQALRNQPPAPRLIEASYKASLVEAPGKRGVRGYAEPYLSGRGHWTIHHAGPGPGVLPLRPLSLALTQTRFENREALVGDFDGDGQGVLLDKTGQQEVLFEWTARGDQKPDGIHFDWRVPATPLATLELELPAGRTVSVVPESCLVRDTGPAESPDRRLWTIYCSRHSVLHLTINPDPEASPPDRGGMLFVNLVRSQHVLAPEGETSEFSFDLKVTARGVQSLSFACDPPLVPYKVALPDGPVPLDRWEFQPPLKPGGRGTLTLHFREPVHGALSPRIICRGTLGRPRPPGPEGAVASTERRDWVCPGLYVLPGVHPPRTETIELRCHPQLRMEDWQPGDFRLTGAKTERDGTYHLRLSAIGFRQSAVDNRPDQPASSERRQPMADSRRPRAVLRTHGVDYRANVLAWWQLDGTSPVLTARIAYDVRYGRLFELPLLVSPGWEVERVWCSAPGDPLRNWTMNPALPSALLGGQSVNLLLVELQPPFEAHRSGETPTLSVRFRWHGAGLPSPTGRRPEKTWTAALPALFPLHASSVEGGLAVDWDDELFEATCTPALTLSRKKRPPAGLWDTHTPRVWIPWRGQPTQGTLSLAPRPAELRTRSINEVWLGSSHLTVSTRLTLEVESGLVGSVDLSVIPPPPGSPPLTWTAVRGQESAGRPSSLTPDARLLTPGFERIPQAGTAAALSALAAPHPLGAAAFFTPPLAAERWRLTLTRPLRAQQSLTLRTTRSLRWPPVAEGFPIDEQAFWPVPLVIPTGNGYVEGEVRLYAEHGEPPADAIVPFGLRERTGANETSIRAGGSRLWRAYTQTSPAVGLSLRALPVKERNSGPLQTVSRREAVVPRATLLTRVEPKGRLIHRFTFEVRGWAQPTLPLRLPAGARLAAVHVDGREVPSLPLDPESSDPVVVLPVPASPGDKRTRWKGEKETEDLFSPAHSFEVVYVTERRGCGLWARFEAPAPELPLRPLAWRRIWRLPASLMPVVQTSLTRLPGPELPGPLAVLPTGQPLPSLSALLSRALSLDRWVARQEEAVRAADARLRRDVASREATLAEALSLLAFEGLATQDEGLVLDAAALEDAGLHPGSTFRPGQAARVGETEGPALASLAPLELVYVPCRPAPLVTTRRQWQAWQQAGRGPWGESTSSQDAADDAREVEELVPESVTSAVVAALTDGHDLSGRFRTVEDWLNHQESGIRSQESARSPSSLGPDSWLLTPDSWVDWEVVAGVEAEETLWVVRTGVPSAGGLVLAGLVLLWAWGARRGPARPGWKGASGVADASAPAVPRRLALARLLCGVAATGLAWIWLPAGLHDLARGPLVAACGVALWWYLTPRGHHGTGRETTRTPAPPPRGEAQALPNGTAEPAPPAPAENGGRLGSASAGVLAALLAAWATGPAAPPPLSPAAADLPRTATRAEETTVFLLPDTGDKAPLAVLVPPALLERLGRRPAAGPPSPSAVLVAAQYQGTLKKLGERTVRFEATFQVYCTGAGPTTLEVPLEGRNLVPEPEVLLDGRPTALTALPAPRPGYALTIAGKGLKTIRMGFRAEVTGDDVRELLFDIPRVASSRLSLRLPPGSAFPQALVKAGAQRVSQDEAGLLLEADLGAPLAAEGTLPRPPAAGTPVPVHLRWREPRPGQVAQVRFQEAYLWDLGQGGHTLTCVLHYTVARGAVPRLTVDIPAELLVDRVEARRPASADGRARSADEAAVRLRDWQLEESPPSGAARRRGSRPLHLDFQAPVSGEVAVLLVLYPRDFAGWVVGGSEGVTPATNPPIPRPSNHPLRVTLPVPQPRGTPLPRQGYLAYRLHGLEARLIDNRRVEGIGPSEFPAFFWQMAGRSAAPAYTCRIVPEGEGTARPRLTLAVRPAAARREGTLRIAWQVGPVYADFHAVLDLAAPDSDLALIEWKVPAAVDVATVSGPQVRQWSLTRRGGEPGRLQVWLRDAVEHARLEVSGSTALTPRPVPERPWWAAGLPLSAALRQELANSTLFELPGLRVTGVELDRLASRVELTAGEGLDLIFQSMSGVQVLLGQGRGSRAGEAGVLTEFLRLLSGKTRALALAVRQKQYGGRLVVVPARPPAVRVVTTVDIKERQYTFEARVEVLSAEPVSSSLELRLGNWRGPAPLLKEESGRTKEEQKTKTSSDSSFIHHPSAFPVTLSGRMPLEEALAANGLLGGEALPVPRVRVGNAGSVESWLVLGKGAAAFRPHVRTGGVAPARPLLPEPLGERPAAVGYRLSARDARPLVLLADSRGPRAEGRLPVRVLLREQVSAAPDGQRWLHETIWWLHHAAATELVFTLPEGVKVLGATLDGQEQPLPQRDGAAAVPLLLPLSGEGARRLSLRWQHTEERETLSRPGLRGPRLRGDDEAAATWTLVVPAGFQVSVGAFQAGPLAAARRELRRAETQLKLTRLLLAAVGAEPKAEGRRAVTEAQRRFALSCRQAEELVQAFGQAAKQAGAGVKDARPGTVAESEELRERLDALRRENRALMAGPVWQAVRVEAERLARPEGRFAGEAVATERQVAWSVEGLAETGRPFYRLSGGTSAAVEVAAPGLVSAASLERRRALAATALLLGVLFGVWLLSAFPSLVARARWFWPEQVLLLGLLGLQRWGATWLVVFLLVLGVSARVLSLLGGLLRLLQRPRTGRKAAV